MRYAADRKEKTRARILGAAGRVFRREGYHAAGVDMVMAEAGLTAGGFYSHFDSKQALLGEALERAAADAGERLGPSTAGRAACDWVKGFLERYLSTKHCGEVEDGCPLVALVSEIARAGEPVKERFEAIVRAMVKSLESHALACGGADDEDRAIAAVALCVGGLGLARGVHDAAYAERILASCQKLAAEMLSVSVKRAPGAKASPRRKGRAS